MCRNDQGGGHCDPVSAVPGREQHLHDKASSRRSAYHLATSLAVLLCLARLPCDAISRLHTAQSSQLLP